MQLFNALLRILFVGESCHLAREVHNTVLHLYVNVAEFLVAELFLNGGLYLRVRSLLCFRARSHCTQ